jgi:hypothetical protein
MSRFSVPHPRYRNKYEHLKKFKRRFKEKPKKFNSVLTIMHLVCKLKGKSAEESDHRSYGIVQRVGINLHTMSLLHAFNSVKFKNRFRGRECAHTRTS